MSKFKVLSIDGGGIRGLIPARILQRIEEETGTPSYEMFDLIAGTSTGGILALALTTPNGEGRNKYSAQDLAELYINEGENIFSRSIWHRARAWGSVLEEKYPSQGINKILQKYFGDVMLSQALTEVLITSYDIERRNPYFFKRVKALRDDSKEDFPMRRTARATSAAPTYFEPCLIGSDGVKRYVLVDGGVFANNPAMCAWSEAMALKQPDDEIMVVSLGTGELTRPYEYEAAKDWGLAGWARPVLDIMFDGVSDATDYQMRQLLKPVDGEERYFRAQVKLTEGNDDMDDAGTTNLRALEYLADEWLNKNDQVIERLVKQLKS